MHYRPYLETLESRLTPTTLPAGFSETVFATGLSRPNAFALAPDGRFFVAEQDGNIRIVQNGQTLATPFVSLPVDNTGERGILGLTLDPNFSSNGFVYVYYTTPLAMAHNRVSRFTAVGNVAFAGSEVPLLEFDFLVGGFNANGGGLRFGIDGKLYVGVGDNNLLGAQSLQNRLGKILRINPDGTIPADNPFILNNNNTGQLTTFGQNDAIWAIGFRNPFGLAVQPGTGRLFINDQGATIQEVNQGLRGGNFGWPVAEGTTINNPGFVNPRFAYQNGGGTRNGFYITGGAFYNPATQLFPADFAGDYFFADLTNDWIRRLDLANNQVFDFATNLTTIDPVGLEVDAAGTLFVLARGDTSGLNRGTITRISFISQENQDYVGLLYQDFLGRTGAVAELNYWAAQIPARGRVAVAHDIQYSRAALDLRVDRLYRELLGRPADAAGLDFWANQLQAGAPIEQIIVGLTASTAEFGNRANVLIGGANADENYVRGLYQVLLRRAASAADVSFWLGVLAANGRDDVAFGFATSAEFRLRAAQSFYGDPTLTPVPFQLYWTNLLRRGAAPATADLNFWVTRPFDLLLVEANFAASDEYFARA